MSNPLSLRETECLRLVLDGLTRDEMAAMLGLGKTTVDVYLCRASVGVAVNERAWQRWLRGR